MYIFQGEFVSDSLGPMGPQKLDQKFSKKDPPKQTRTDIEGQQKFKW